MTGEFERLLESLDARVLQRDWLSANHIVFRAAGPNAPSTVIDTGYARHAAMTTALVDRALGGQELARIINTHLHSDHCGGNRALQDVHPAHTLVPSPSFEAAKQWDDDRLSYRATGQLCAQFRVDGCIAAGDRLQLGPATWEVHAAPGHDPEAMMLFEPQTRTLISGDALWEDRLAIIFPELFGEDGFVATRRTLALIESLSPLVVIPGHGSAFGDVGSALAASRRRLDAFEANPSRHAQHAARALVMFHMMEHEVRRRDDLEQWLPATPIFQLAAKAGHGATDTAQWARSLVNRLLDDGLLHVRGDFVCLYAQVT